MVKDLPKTRDDPEGKESNTSIEEENYYQIVTDSENPVTTDDNSHQKATYNSNDNESDSQLINMKRETVSKRELAGSKHISLPAISSKRGLVKYNTETSDGQDDATNFVLLILKRVRTDKEQNQIKQSLFVVYLNKTTSNICDEHVSSENLVNKVMDIFTSLKRSTEDVRGLELTQPTCLIQPTHPFDAQVIALLQFRLEKWTHKAAMKNRINNSTIQSYICKVLLSLSIDYHTLVYMKVSTQTSGIETIGYERNPYKIMFQYTAKSSGKMALQHVKELWKQLSKTKVPHKPITIDMLRTAATLAGAEIEEMFNGGPNSEQPELLYVLLFPDDCRMVLSLPTTRGSYLHGKDELDNYAHSHSFHSL